MDSDTSSFILSNGNLHSMYYRRDAEETAIDLGLSLTTMRPQPRYEETRAQNKKTWTYVKVNMDGVIVGRKICILYHDGYSSLALQLEDMFGNKSSNYNRQLHVRVKQHDVLFRLFFFTLIFR